MIITIEYNENGISGSMQFSAIEDAVRFVEFLRPSSNMVFLLLADGGTNKIQCIKVVREITKWGLQESKEFVEGAPRILPKMSIESARKWLAEFERIGARAQIGDGT